MGYKIQILPIKIFTAKHWGPGGRGWVLKGHVHCGTKPFPLIRGGKNLDRKPKRNGTEARTVKLTLLLKQQSKT